MMLEINFCDRCDASIPQEDLDSGRARDDNGVLTCVHCLSRRGFDWRLVLIPVALLLSACLGAFGAVLVLGPRIGKLEEAMGTVEADLETATAPDPGRADEFLAIRKLDEEQTERIEELSTALSRGLEKLSAAVTKSVGQSESIAREIREIKDHLEVLGRPPVPAETPSEEEDIEFLLGLTGDADPGKRLSALVELTKSGDPRVPPKAIEALADPDMHVRAQAASLLGARKVREGVPKLIERLSDEQVIVRASAHRALKSISGKEFGYDPTDDAPAREKAIGLWRDWWVVEGPR
jgi:hypothetical protein